MKNEEVHTMQTTAKQQIISLALALALVLPLMPGVTLTAYAESTLYVDGEQVSDATSQDAGGVGWVWDAANQFLILTDYNGGFISAEGSDLTVQLNGTNVITAVDNPFGLYATGNLTITADTAATLTVAVTASGNEVCGIDTAANLFIGGNAAVTAEATIDDGTGPAVFGIRAVESIVISTSGDVTSRATHRAASALQDSYGFYLADAKNAPKLTINGSGAVRGETLGTGNKAAIASVNPDVVWDLGNHALITEPAEGQFIDNYLYGPVGIPASVGVISYSAEPVLPENSGESTDGANDAGVPLTFGTTTFTDVTTSDWFYADVEYVVTNNLFNGVSANAFKPHDYMTRGMLITALYHLAGSPSTAGAASNTFSDVPAGAYYCDAVAWAAHTEVISGVGQGKFAPENAVSRQDAAVILMRYARAAKQNFVATEEYHFFTDDAKIAAYAKNDIQILVNGGIMSGDSGGNTITIDPEGSATRAEIASLLYRFVKKTT
jgi:hypothetical protein